MRISDWSSDVCSSDLVSPDKEWSGACSPSSTATTRRRQNATGDFKRPRRIVARHPPVPGRRAAAELPRHGGGGDGERRLGQRHIQRTSPPAGTRSEEHTSELQSLMRISYAVFCLKKKKTHKHNA